MVGMWEHVYQQQQGGGATGEEAAGPSRWQRMGQEAVRAGGWMRGVLLHGVLVDIHAVRGSRGGLGAGRAAAWRVGGHLYGDEERGRGEGALHSVCRRQDFDYLASPCLILNVTLHQ